MPRRRQSGLLIHITSLPGAYSVGDMGPQAVDFAGHMSRLGFSVWQMLPLTPTAEIFGNSPYCAPSAFAGNLLLVSPDALAQEGLVTREELAAWFAPSVGRADFASAHSCKKSLLALAWRRFCAEPEKFADVRGEYEAFCAEEDFWLRDYSLFTLLKEKFDGAPWAAWPAPYAAHDESALDLLLCEEKEGVDFIRFCQFVFYRQLRALSLRCAECGVTLMGDLPIYIAWDSADVWASRELFDLDERGFPRGVAGVPPDYFSPTGQRWGNPLYNWERMRADDFAWWRARIAHTLKYFGLLRIDHFRGLCAFWAIPSSEPTAVNGEWRQAQGKEMLRAFQKIDWAGRGPLPFIAEDLGIITDDVRDLMRELGLPGMKVLMFAFGGEADNPYLPHNTEPASVVYTGTHDNDTAVGWWRAGSSVRERINFSLYSGREVTRENAAAVMTRMALSSAAELAVVPVQDILGLDGSCRMNVPSQASGSWQWRLTPQQMKSIAEPGCDFVGVLKELNKIYGRI